MICFVSRLVRGIDEAIAPKQPVVAAYGLDGPLTLRKWRWTFKQRAADPVAQPDRASAF